MHLLNFLAVNFQEVVHSVLAGKADVVRHSDSRSDAGRPQSGFAINCKEGGERHDSQVFFAALARRSRRAGLP
jgi:hypothetical protein